MQLSVSSCLYTYIFDLKEIIEYNNFIIAFQIPSVDLYKPWEYRGLRQYLPVKLFMVK